MSECICPLCGGEVEHMIHPTYPAQDHYRCLKCGHHEDIKRPMPPKYYAPFTNIILIALLFSIPCFAQSYLGNHDYNIRQSINYKDLKTTYEPKTKYREDFQQLLSYAGLDLPKVAEGRYAKTFEKATKVQLDHSPTLSIKAGTTIECVSKGGDDYQLRSSQPIRMDYGFIMRGTMSNMEVSYNRDDGFLSIQKSDVKDLRGSWGLEKVLGQGRGWENIRF